MKNLGKLAFLFLAVAAVVAMSPASHAVCAVNVTFSQYPSAGACGAYCYTISPGEASAASFNTSVFWVVGKGNPTDGVGTDNGVYKADGTGGNQAWLQGPYPGGWQINSGWSAGETDGCGDVTTDNMVAAIFDRDASGSTAYYALLGANLDFARPAQWDFATGGSATLREIPRLTISSSTSAGPGVKNITVTWTPNVDSAFYANSSTTTAAAVVTGYSVYKFETSGTAPLNRARTAWTSVASVTGSAANTATFTLNCATTAGNVAYLALGLDFNSGFKSGYVGANSTRIACDPNMADPDAKFKLIDKKPRTTRTRR